MTEIVPVTAVTPDDDFSGIQFSRSKSGHIHSPWWTYRWRDYDKVSPYTIGSFFHGLRSRSQFAFACALGLKESDVICSQRENAETGELEWRIGTIHPCALPKPRLSQVERMLAIEGLVKQVEGDGPAIDI